VIAAHSPGTRSKPAIIQAQRGDITHIAAVIGAAFQELAVAHWIIACDDDRERVLAANMEIWVEHAFDTGGVVDMTADRAGVAVWFINACDSDGESDAMPAEYDARLNDACGVYADRFRALDQAFSQNHPNDQPHHHLAFLAVTPHGQGAGAGSALLDDHFLRYPNVGSYLEASCPDSRRLYMRHGFTDLTEPFVLPSGGPQMWPMWRPAGTGPPDHH
jgi:GNAT superfamily N-acetyltransferase